MDVFAWLTHWYSLYYDRDWARGAGAEICTIDNPGWRVKIGLQGTSCDGQRLDRMTHKFLHPTDWWTCWTEDNAFHAAGGPGQLCTMLDQFRAWAESVGTTKDAAPLSEV